MSVDQLRPAAIPTWYAGCHFRSRLEARWAVFFDAAGIRWEYEKQGYSLPSGPYLPDFWLPDIEHWHDKGIWVEVKGQEVSDLEYRLAGDLANGTRHAVLLLCGDIPRDVAESDGYTMLYPCNLTDPESGAEWDSWRKFCVCPDCGKIGVEYGGLGNRICHGASSERKDTSGYRRLLKAYDAARSARFERAS